MNIVGNSVGYPICNSLGHLMHPVDSTGVHFVEKTVVLGVSSTDNASSASSRSARAGFYGIWSASPWVLSGYASGDKVSATVIVPNTAEWGITVYPDSPQFKMSATGVSESSIQASDGIGESVRYTVGSSAPDVISIDVDRNYNYPYYVNYHESWVPNRRRKTGADVQTDAGWQADLMFPDSWSADEFKRHLLGASRGYYSASENSYYSSRHRSINTTAFLEMGITASGDMYPRAGEYGMTSFLRLGDYFETQNPRIYDSAVATGTNVSVPFTLTATAADYHAYVTNWLWNVSASAYKSTGSLPYISWTITGWAK